MPSVVLDNAVVLIVNVFSRDQILELFLLLVTVLIIFLGGRDNDKEVGTLWTWFGVDIRILPSLCFLLSGARR